MAYAERACGDAIRYVSMRMEHTYATCMRAEDAGIAYSSSSTACFTTATLSTTTSYYYSLSLSLMCVCVCERERERERESYVYEKGGRGHSMYAHATCAYASHVIRATHVYAYTTCMRAEDAGIACACYLLVQA